MTSSDQQILDELYKLDPTLRDHEQRLKELITLLRAERPDVTPNPQFVRELRGLLLKRAGELSAPRASFFSAFTMPNFSYAVTGAILGVLVAGPTAYWLSQNGSTLTPAAEESDGALFTYAVTRTDDGAFGSLTQAQPENGNTRTGGGGMGGDTVAASPRPQSGGGGPESAMMDAKIGIFPPVSYEYVYRLSGSGALPGLDAASVDVLKRQRSKASVSLSAIASHFRTPFLNLESFAGAQVDNVTFSERGDRGYMINVNLRDGSMNVNQNWDTWPHPENQCQDDACWARYRVKISDMLPDDQVIAIADAFAKSHGIDLSLYGAPEVNAQWRQDYERVQDKSQAWVPDVQTVVYPFLVEGKAVYDESGNKSGISINVNVRQKAVADVWGIQDQTYASSAYDAVTDEGQITAFLKQLDAQPVMPLAMEDGTRIEKKTITVSLGRPELAYAKYFLYGDGSQPPQELIVPSLVFPVEQTAGDENIGFWRRAVVVPLAKELLDQRLAPAGGGVMYKDAPRG